MLYDRKEFVQGVAALSVSVAAGISFGAAHARLPQDLQVADGRSQLHRQVDSREVVARPYAANLWYNMGVHLKV